MHVISNRIVFWLLQAAIEKNVDLSPVYEKYDFQPLALDSQTPLFSSGQFASLMRELFELTEDESAGYTDKPLRLGTFRMLCHATINCGNLRQALLRMMQYFKLLSDELDWSLKEQGEDAILVFEHHTKRPPINGYFVSCMFTIIWRWAAWMVDYPLLLNRVSFRFGSDGYQQELNAIFRTPLYFKQNQNQLVLPAHYLNLPVKQNSQSLTGFLQNSPECLLSHYQPDKSVSAQVKYQLGLLERVEPSTLTSIATHFNCSAQTLARRLKSEGHQFQEIKDKVRKEKAINLLLQTDLSIDNISAQLGFSEDSVFYRTFKKWTGVTPTQFRQQRN